jgi:hypothetical protein
MKTLMLAALLALSAVPLAAAEECDFVDTVWRSDQGEYSRILYFDPVGSPDHHSVVVETYEGGTLLMRAHGSVVYNKYGPELGSMRILKEYVPSSAESGVVIPDDLFVSGDFLDLEQLRSTPGEPEWLIIRGLTDQVRLLKQSYGKYFLPYGLQADAFLKSGCRQGPLDFAVTKEEADAPGACGWNSGYIYRGDDLAFGIHACTMDRSQAYLALSCAFQKGAIMVQYDLAKGIEGAPMDGGSIDVTFSTEKGSWVLVMTGNEMDGLYEAQIGQVNPVVELIAGSTMLTISDGRGDYPIRKVELDGSREAVETLMTECRRQQD